MAPDDDQVGAMIADEAEQAIAGLDIADLDLADVNAGYLEDVPSACAWR